MFSRAVFNILYFDARTRAGRAARGARGRRGRRRRRGPPGPGGVGARVAACRSGGGVPPGVPRPRFSHAGPPSSALPHGGPVRVGIYPVTHALPYYLAAVRVPPRVRVCAARAARAREPAPHVISGTGSPLSSSAGSGLSGPELPSIVVPPRRTTAARH